MLDDIRFAFRSVWRQKRMSVMAVLAFMLGIGCSTAVFSVLIAVVLTPLPYPQASQLASIFRVNQSVSNGPFSTQDFADLRDHLTGRASVAGSQRLSYTVGGSEGVERIAGARVTEEFFSVFALAPFRGRWLDDADQSGGSNGVVVSYNFWRQRLGARDAAIGETVLVDGQARTVVGIAPPELAFPRDSELWLPMQLQLLPLQRGNSFITATARVRAGVGLAEMQAQLDSLAQRWATDYPRNHRGLTLRVVEVQEALLGSLPSTLWLLMSAVTLLMVIVCCNVANLLLGRMLAREREYVTCAAIGAPPLRLSRQILFEALIISSIGALLGLVLAVVLAPVPSSRFSPRAER